MKLKKLLSLFLILALCLSFTACAADVDVDVDVRLPDNLASSTTVAESTIAGTDSTTAPTTDTTAPPTTSVTIRPVSTVTTTASQAGKPTTAVITLAPTTTPTASAADKALVDRAFELAQGAKIENVTLTGVVTSSQGYSAGYGNATFDLQVEGTSGAKTIYCYRVKPADSARPDVAVGDALSLSGTIQNYKGTIEFYPATYTHLSGGGIVTTRTTAVGSAAIAEDGIYESKEDVALYIHVYGKLPRNFVRKSQYNSLGKPADKCCGGDRFYNKEGLLPTKSGRLYYECDIDTYGVTYRGQKRIVYSNDGLIYYTGDHYASFTLLYGTP